MLQYSTYSVISPEGCASILWKSADKAAVAADVLGITAKRLRELGLIDQIIGEPLGGAHRDVDQMAYSLKENLAENIEILDAIGIDKLLDQRYNRLMNFGAYIET